MHICGAKIFSSTWATRPNFSRVSPRFDEANPSGSWLLPKRTRRRRSQSPISPSTTQGRMFVNASSRPRATAERSLALAPELGAGARGNWARSMDRIFLNSTARWLSTNEALALSPNDADVLMRAGQLFFSDMGRADAGVTSARRGVALDQLNHRAHSILGSTLEAAHRHREAIEAFSRALALNQNDARASCIPRSNRYWGWASVESARQSWPRHR